MAKKETIIEAAAHAAHEANRAYCRALGDFSQPAWDDAPDWQKASAREGVKGVIDGNSPEDSHKSWLAHKEADGWVYGPVKDPDNKEHPCMVPYNKLPPEQQWKDYLFVHTVRDMISAIRPS